MTIDSSLSTAMTRRARLDSAPSPAGAAEAADPGAHDAVLDGTLHVVAGDGTRAHAFAHAETMTVSPNGLAATPGSPADKVQPPGARADAGPDHDALAQQVVQQESWVVAYLRNVITAQLGLHSPLGTQVVTQVTSQALQYAGMEEYMAGELAGVLSPTLTEGLMLTGTGLAHWGRDWLGIAQPGEPAALTPSGG